MKIKVSPLLLHRERQPETGSLLLVQITFLRFFLFNPCNWAVPALQESTAYFCLGGTKKRNLKSPLIPYQDSLPPATILDSSAAVIECYVFGSPNAGSPPKSLNTIDQSPAAVYSSRGSFVPCGMYSKLLVCRSEAPWRASSMWRPQHASNHP